MRAELARAKSLYEKHVIAVQQIEQTRVAARRIEGEHRMAVAELEESAARVVLSGTIVNVAVPDVMGTFGVGQGMAQFLATAYLATMTASQLLGRWIIGLLGRRTEFHVDAMAATQNADNAAMREMLSNAADLLAPSGLPESTYDLVALDYLGQVIAAQASTIAYQDGFLLVTFVFVIALLPTGLIGWLDRRRRMA